MHKFKGKIENGMFVLGKEEFERFKEYLKEIEAENERIRDRAEMIRLDLKNRVVENGEYTLYLPSFIGFAGRQLDRTSPTFNKKEVGHDNQ